MDLLLVRHGETEYNRIGRCQGWTDEPLNETGRRQAQEVADHLSRHPVRHILASPLKRAHETAQAIAGPHRAPVELDEDLRELYHGVLEGVPFSELNNHVPGILEAWKTRPHTVAMPGGETLADLQARACKAIDAYATAVHPTDGARHVVVAHALTIATILCRTENVGLDEMRRFRLLPCGYWHIRHEDGAWHAQGVHRPMPDESRI